MENPTEQSEIVATIQTLIRDLGNQHTTANDSILQRLTDIEKRLDTLTRSSVTKRSQGELRKNVKEGHRTGLFLHWGGILIGVIGIVVAIWLGIDDYKSRQETATLVKDISGSLLTTSLGNWPNHFGKITDLIGAASEKDQIYILTDSVGDWHYTLPEQYYADFYSKLKNTKAHVQMLVYDRATSIDRLTQQFTPDNFKRKSAQDTGECRYGYFESQPEPGKTAFFKYDHYLESYKTKRSMGITLDLPKECPIDYLGFINLILKVEDHLCGDLSRTVEIRTLTNSAFKQNTDAYWIVPSKGIIVSMRKYMDVNAGWAFFINNNQIIKEFVQQFGDQWKESVQKEARTQKKTLIQGSFCYSDQPTVVTEEELNQHLAARTVAH